jgi:hypothetical protein
VRAALLLWGGWLVVTGLVFSLSTGVIHTYYTVALAPAVAALVAAGGAMAWKARETRVVRALLAGVVLITALWSFVLLDRTPQWESWLRAVVLASAVVAVAGLVAGSALRRFGRRLTLAIAACAAVACLAGPVAYSAQTIATAHTGSIPSAGPSTGGGFGPGGGGRGPGTESTSSALVKALESGSGRYRWVAAVSGSQTAAGLELATGGDPVMAIGGFNNQGGNLSLAQFEKYVARGEIHYYVAGGGIGGGALAGPGGGARSSGAGGGPPAGAFGGSGGPPSGAAGASGGPPSGAAGAGGSPPSGSFGATGSRSAGLRGGGGFGARPGGSSTSAITTWVKAHFKAVTIGGQTVYDLTQRTS